MPTTASPSAGAFTAADLTALISYLVDGDAVNSDSLMKEAAPGGTPKLTLFRLANLLAMVGTSSAPLGSPTFTDTVTLPGAPAFTGPPSVTRASKAPPINFTTPTNGWNGGCPLTAGDQISHMMDVPHGAVITGLTVHLVGGSHSSLPATMPKFWLFQYNIITTAGTTIGTVTDASGSTGVYAPVHPISLSGLSTTVDRTQNVYYVLFNAESGGNSNNASIYVGATWTANIPTLDIGG